MDINKHKYYLIQVLLAIFRDQELSRLLAFKGGTSLMLFHNLTRFSTDLDFNLLDPSQADKVYQRLHQLLLRFGTIDDEANKFWTMLPKTLSASSCFRKQPLLWNFLQWFR